jgi:hypothetical protein
MWLFTRYGFYSVACADKPDGTIDPATLMIRSRRRAHLENLKKRFPSLAEANIVRLRGRDYRWRLFVPKDHWVEVISELAREQEWSNFKNEAARYLGKSGSSYTHALHKVWGTMNDLQTAEPEPRVTGTGQTAL